MQGIAFQIGINHTIQANCFEELRKRGVVLNPLPRPQGGEIDYNQWPNLPEKCLYENQLHF